MDQFVNDATYGLFMRTADPLLDPLPLRYPHNLTRSLPEGITPKELGIINLTAQFMAVFGIFFQRALIKTVITDPRFDFMIKAPDDCKNSVYYGLLAGYMPTDDSKFSFYCRLFRGYLAVSKPCQDLTKNAGASPETVLEGFFHLLALLEDEEKIGMVDLHVFEFLAKTLGYWTLPPGHLSDMLHSPMIELLRTPIHGMPMPDDWHDKIRVMETEIHDVESRRTWRNSVSYHACYQQMQILSQEDHAFCEHPKDLQQNNSNDQGPSAHSLPSPWSGLPLPEFTSLIPEGITRQELGIIKLTAQFDGVYGIYFREEIEKLLIEDPRFAFLKPTDNSKYYSFFSNLSLGYDMVLIPSRKKGEALLPNRKMSGSPSLETVLEGFWNLFEMVEEGVDMGIVDLHAFEFFANTEDQELNLPHQYLLMIMYPLVPPFAHLQARMPRGYYPLAPPRDLPNPKRLKLDKDSSRPGLVEQSSLSEGGGGEKEGETSLQGGNAF
ncbi:unnamed protein product [Arabidopsis arenosa]|uniref:SURP motif domain-containing protein n=1 Tax=Arabidopsis arenosa TaxID=38785 RepID=A0A8S2AEA5_ARAAE|nr:unnamed protein product [Arabidopsis arenosa]